MRPPRALLCLPLACLAAAAALAAPDGGTAQGAPARHVVSQTVGTDELLLALADPGQVAALSHLSRDRSFSVVAREAASIPALKSADAESVISFSPDLVLLASYTEPATLSLLRKAGVRLLIVDRFDTLEDVYGNLRLLGDALGHRDRAEALIALSQKRVAALAERLAGVRPVRVLAVSTYPFTAGAETTFQDLCEHAGALNVAAEAGLRGHVTTPAERLLTWRAEVLVGSEGDGADAAARLAQVPAYRPLEAMKAGRLVLLPGALMASVSHHRIEAYELLARKLHPERFP
jgi:iron complex transport system substrate-binding protein